MLDDNELFNEKQSRVMQQQFGAGSYQFTRVGY